jgi:hypothetical protein
MSAQQQDELMPGQVLTLVRSSPRHREYELRCGDRPVGSLRWPAGGRAGAEGTLEGIGPIRLDHDRRARKLVLRADEPGTVGVVVTTIDRGRSSAVDERGPTWITHGRNRWTMDENHRVVMRFTGRAGLVKQWVRVEVEHAVSGDLGMPLAMAGCFLVLEELQREQDAAAAVPAIIPSV